MTLPDDVSPDGGLHHAIEKSVAPPQAWLQLEYAMRKRRFVPGEPFRDGIADRTNARLVESARQVAGILIRLALVIEERL